MKVIKFFAWEVPFLARISEYRQKEMKHVFLRIYLHFIVLLTHNQVYPDIAIDSRRK